MQKNKNDKSKKRQYKNGNYKKYTIQRFWELVCENIKDDKPFSWKELSEKLSIKGAGNHIIPLLKKDYLRYRSGCLSVNEEKRGKEFEREEEKNMRMISDA